MKVHCKECRCFKDNSVPEHMVCTHETNTEYKHNWYSKLEVYLEHPSSLNTNNDCKNFNPFVDEPICNSQIENPTVSKTESVEKNCESCNRYTDNNLYCNGNDDNVCEDWKPKQPKSEYDKGATGGKITTKADPKVVNEKLLQVIQKVYELANDDYWNREEILMAIAELTKPYKGE